MNTKRITGWLVAAVLYGMAAITLAEPIRLDSCGEVCPGHVISGKERIHVCSGTHNIILDGVKVELSDQEGACAFLMEDDTRVFLTLKNRNDLESGSGCAGIQVPSGAELIVTVDSTGSLHAKGGREGAGIGGGSGQDAGTIRILGGKIWAIGGKNSRGSGAGIGGGFRGSFDEILISGGIVKATGMSGGAGIGGGCTGKGSLITITGGVVDAEADVSDFISGAGIGGGANRSSGTIVIEGGIVSARTMYYDGKPTGAGIGGGENDGCDSITIRGGMIIAGAGSTGAGIGASSNGAVGEIVIDGGFVRAGGGAWGGVGIGGEYSYLQMRGVIEINGGTVVAKGGSTERFNPGAAGIGGSVNHQSPEIVITGGYVQANGGEGGYLAGAGIGSSGGMSANRIDISGGSIVANAGGDEETVYGGAGIGGGGLGLARRIVIWGGRITANGSGRSAGIGDGERSSPSVWISGGDVTANGGEGYDGITGVLAQAGGNVVSSCRTLEPNAMEDDNWPRRTDDDE